MDLLQYPQWRLGVTGVSYETTWASYFKIYHDVVLDSLYFYYGSTHFKQVYSIEKGDFAQPRQLAGFLVFKSESVVVTVL